jgi:phosphatidylinositol glycan class A protein
MKIALMSDFFYPRLGGVEMHIYSLAQRLIAQGHKVIVITHAYKINDSSQRTGVRYLPGPLKVYYCPIIPMVDQDSLPTFAATLPIMRYIFIREDIQIIHAHQATSTLANESIAYAGEMGIPSVYTDHSLFGFDDLASVILNRVMKATLSTASAIICVSHTCRENLIMRANIDPTIVHAIPNAIDAKKFQPDFDRHMNKQTRIKPERVKIVIVSRLVYRKGVDLLVGIIPRICAQFNDVDFIIGGDGAKKLALEEMVERERLQDRVEFLGSVPHAQVRDVLVRGHIFLNCSLTESFCIAILEAASCGLFVVSTEVGGVPEVLPEDLIMMGAPNVEELTKVLARAIHEKTDFGSNASCRIAHDPVESHTRISTMYSWDRVATKTVSVYEQVLKNQKLTFLQRLARYRTVGPFAGYVVCMMAVSLHFLLAIVEWLQPRNQIDVVPDLKPFEPEQLFKEMQNRDKRASNK